MQKKKDRDAVEEVKTPKRDRKITKVEDRYWNFFNRIRKGFKLSWNQVFKRFSLYGNGIIYIFQAPPEITKHLQLDINTVIGLTDLWVNNIRDNWNAIHEEPWRTILFLRKYGHYAGKPAIVIGAGPSLLEHDHLKRLARADFPGPIISTSHSLKWCYEKGVIPEMSAIVDGNREKIVKFIDDPVVEAHMKETKMVFCASAASNAVERWKGERFFFLSPIPNNIFPNIDRVMWQFVPHLPVMDTGGNCGAFCVNLAAFLGCSPIILLGLDYAYPEGFPYEKTQYYDAWMQSVGEGRPYPDIETMHEQIFEHQVHPTFKNRYYTDFVYRVFLHNFREAMTVYPDQIGFKVINATEGGAIHGKNIQCMTFKKALKLYSRGSNSARDRTIDSMAGKISIGREVALEEVLELKKDPYGGDD